MNTYLIVFLGLVIFASYQYVADARPPLKIINGTIAEDGEFPYMVQLRVNRTFICGGGIIGSEWILTAGHCVAEEIDSIVYGTNKLNEANDTNAIKVKKLFQHPQFRYTVDGIPIYDVGIIQLEEAIPFSENANIIRIADDDKNIPFHVQGLLSGWGKRSMVGGASPDLIKINLQLLNDEECTTKINDYSGKNSFNSTHDLCSDDSNNGECNGDSGSPYVINGTQYGLVSWSYKPCGVISGTYSRITNPEYRDWIRNITNI